MLSFFFLNICISIVLSQEHQESLREAIELQPPEEQREYNLGSDAEGNVYIHFPQFCGADLRVYRHKPFPDPYLENEDVNEDFEVESSVKEKMVMQMYLWIIFLFFLSLYFSYVFSLYLV